MNLLNKIKNSFYNPEFYNGIKEQRLGQSLKYFFSLVAVLSVIIAFVLGIELSPVFSAENLRRLTDFYPKELSIQIKGGDISTNVDEPYMIKEITEGVPLDKNSFENLIVIDTKNNFSIESFKGYNTRVLIGKNFVVTTKRAGQFEFNDVSKLPDFSLSQDRILHWAELIGKYHWGISLLLFVCIFISFFWFFSFALLGMLVTAFVVFLLAKLKKIQLSYRNSYQIAIYAFSIPLILETVFILSGMRAPFPFFFGVIAVAISLANFKK